MDEDFSLDETRSVVDPYAALELEHGAATEDIRRAYFRLVRQYQPEAHPEQFKRIRSAYETLRSPARRVAIGLFAFDHSVREIDLDLVGRVNDAFGQFDIVKALLAVELSLSDLTRTDFSGDLTPIREEDLIDRASSTG